ncbi:hypothetical protein PInf_007519 [Phytophthora infestans]|nr:hypothetical protein PInf_007519 [Phytophthora infestans]
MGMRFVKGKSRNIVAESTANVAFRTQYLKKKYPTSTEKNIRASTMMITTASNMDELKNKIIDGFASLTSSTWTKAYTHAQKYETRYMELADQYDLVSEDEGDDQDRKGFESVRKMAGIFGMEALQSLVVSTPAEQLERVNAFDAYEQGLIAHVRENLQAPAAEANSPHLKPIRLKAKPYEGKEGKNLHFWVREVELAMDAALISTEQLRVAFALSNLSGRAKS